MSASRTLCSKCASYLTSVVTRRPGTLARFTTVADARISSSTKRTGSKVKNTPKPLEDESDALNLNNNPNKTNKKKPRRPQKTDPVALFNEVVNKGESPTLKSQAPYESLGELELTAKLNGLKSTRMRARQSLSIFSNDIWPHLRTLPKPYPRHLYLAINDFFCRACDVMVSEAYGKEKLCTRMSKMIAAVGRYDVKVQNGLVLSLCLLLVHEEREAMRSEIAKELISLWKLISQIGRVSQRGQPMQFALTKPEELLADIDRLLEKSTQVPKGKFMDKRILALSAILNNLGVFQVSVLIPGLLATVAVLSDPELIPPQHLADVAPLFELVGTVLQRAELDHSFIKQVFYKMLSKNNGKSPLQERVPELRSLVEDRWPQAVRMLQEKDASWRRGLVKPADPSQAGFGILSKFHKQVRSAYQTDNTGGVIHIWEELNSALKKDSSLALQMRNEPDFLDFWHFIWCAARRPEMLQETQQMMQEIGLPPTIKTYTAMMHGWKKCKDGEKIEALWEVLANSGIKLDIHIWTERISGLIDVGKSQKGVDALAEMLRVWKAAVKNGQPDSAVPPTVEVVNAAFNGLMMRRDKAAAFSVLDWAGREGIRPDVQTYNILLRESLRNGGSSEDIQSLLRSMAESNVQPDTATFTTILEEVLGNMSGATAQEQVEAVDSVFADIKTAGVRPNMEIYAKMLFAVSSLSNGVDEAVEAVLNHMRANGHSSISPHMVLILLERILKHRDSTSNVSDQIAKLLDQHDFKSIVSGDQRLWEHVLSAYSITGDTVRALAVYDELHRAGRAPTRLFCLRDLLVALLENGEFVSAKRFVGEVLDEHKKRLAELPAKRWSHHFWHLAHAYGLLDLDKVPLNLRDAIKSGTP